MFGLQLSIWSVSAIIFLAALITHGMVLLNDGVYWDGWIIDSWQRRRDFATMQTFYSQVGMPFLFHFHRFMARLPQTILWYKALSFACLFLSSFLVYLVCQASGFLTSTESLFIALLMLCYPGQQMTVEPSVIALYVFPLPLFFLACLLGLQAEAAAGMAQWAMRGGAIVLFLISFNMNSLLVFYFGFVALLVFSYLIQAGLNLFGLIWYLLSHVDYLALPFVFWFWKEKYTPRWGVHTNYNRPSFHNPRFQLSYRRLLSEGIVGQIVESFKCLRTAPGKIVLAILVTVFTLYQLRYWDIDFGPTSTTFTWGAVLVFGLVMLGLGTLPYALVGQVFGLQGWETKNNLLLPLPVALIIMSLVNILFVPELHMWIPAAVVAVFILRCNYNYLLLQAVWAKHVSFLRKLSKIPEAKEMSILGLLDLHSVKISLRENPEHPSNTLFFMFERIWGDRTHFGIQVTDVSQVPFSPQRIAQAIHDTCLDWIITEVDREGKQGLIVIKNGESGQRVRLLGLKYIFYRLCKPSVSNYYLDEITQVDFYSPARPTVLTAEGLRPKDTLLRQTDVSGKSNQSQGAFNPLNQALAIRSTRASILTTVGTCLIRLNRLAQRVPYLQRASREPIKVYLTQARFKKGKRVLVQELTAHPNDYSPDLIEVAIEKRLEITPYSSQATQLLFDHIVSQPGYRTRLGASAAERWMLIYDTIFPSLHSSFTTVEFNAYLERFSEACVYTSGSDFVGFDGDSSFDAVRADYAKHYPHLANRVYKVSPKLDYRADLLYTLFLRNMFSMIKLVEAFEIPFVFTLYSGGDLCMDDPTSDAKVQRVFSSPYFRKVIVVQSLVRDYILSKNFVRPDQIEFIYGPICNADYLLKNAIPKKYYGQDKSTFDICFVAYKHMPLGRDKGYDVFIQAAHLLSRFSPAFQFHVVGGFTPEDIDVSDLAGRIHFYGKRPMSFFPSFHSSMDIVLSPCLPFVLAPGALDGAPNISTIEAGLCGVAVFMTDQLKQNKVFENRKDLVIVPHDAWAISEIVEHYFRHPEALYKIAHQGREAFAKVFSRQAQIEPRIRLLESLLTK